MKSKISDELNHLLERVIGAAIAVHRELGPGFLEQTYHRAMMIELEEQGVAFKSEYPVTLTYHGRVLAQGKIDLLIEDQLVVELKAADRNPAEFIRQVTAYLKSTGLSLGLVINFDTELLKDGIARVIHTP